MLCLWYLDAYVGVQCRVYKLNTGKTLSGVPVMHPCLSNPLPSESLAFPNHYVVPTSAPVWIICMSHWTQDHVSICPLECFPKPFQDPLIGRAEHLHYCSRRVNLCLAHPDGAILKQIYIWLDYILQWCKNFLFNNTENYWSWENQLQFSAGLQTWSKTFGWLLTLSYSHVLICEVCVCRAVGEKGANKGNYQFY